MDLGHLDFIENDDFQLSKVSLPDQVPTELKAKELPQELLKSSTVENLISQNQDLMNRLSVALRRLSGLENENQKISEENRKTQLQFQGLREQIQVFSEIESKWKMKVEILETEKALATEKLSAYARRIESLNSATQRHQKYQEKIKTQVKPYIAQLKEFSNSLQTQNMQLENQVCHQQAIISDIRKQIIEVTKNSQLQIENENKKQAELIEFYESQIKELTESNQSLKETAADVEIKTLRLKKALERQDYLENEVVALSRSKEDLKSRLDYELQNLQQKLSDVSRQNQRLGIEHSDLQVRVVEIEAEKQSLSRENQNLKEQLESIRYMWSAKNEENAKLRASLEALEKLNVDLSARLNEVRNKGQG
ncbi:MAG: hypothetical protein ACLGGX_06960 [Bdellovibrionia bacterium]